MSLPQLTHRQYAVLNAIGAQSMSGRDLRECLNEAKIHHSRGAFYQLMARLEDSDFVESWDEEVVIRNQRYKERCYRVTGQGVRAMREVESYYAQGGQAHARA